MERTSIAVKTPTRDRISAAAQAESLTVDAFLGRLLDEHDEHMFWQQLQAITPEEYRAALAEDGDEWVLDPTYEIEDGMIVAAEQEHASA